MWYAGIKSFVILIGYRTATNFMILLDIPDNACVKSFNKLEGLFRTEYQKHKDIALKRAIE